MKPIRIHQAYLHNLKNIDVDIPLDKLVVVTGVSGSGKSSLIFDILYEEGRRRYLQAIGVLSEPIDHQGFDKITGLRPTVAVKQGIVRRSNPRSVVGSYTRVLHYLGALFADFYNQTHAPDDAMSNAQFSFNSPVGMCTTCQGRGYVFELNFDVLIPTDSTTVEQMFVNANMATSFKKFTRRLADRFNLDLNTPFRQLPEVVQNMVLYGHDPEGRQLSALDVNLKSRLLRGKNIANAMTASVCPDCTGFRLNECALAVCIADQHIGQLAHRTIRELDGYIQAIINESDNQLKLSSVGQQLLHRVQRILQQLIAVNLDYLTLYRPIPTLSGGESQRLSLMSFQESDLDSMVYIFDEPTTGLHEVEKATLMEQIDVLRENGNAIIVVEHDSFVISQAEHLIDIGPGAGVEGGEIVYQGDYPNLLQCKKSVTGQYLSVTHQPRARIATEQIEPTAWIALHEVCTNNLNSVNVKIPLGVMTGVAGVSGSGKSSLISDTLIPAIRNYFDDEETILPENEEVDLPLMKAIPRLKKITGLENITRFVEISQAPIGRRSGSNPVTYLGIWDRIRRCFAKQGLAQERGYGAGHFSFNSSGACDHCGGNGIHQMWLGVTLVDYPCDVCNGERYNADVLDVQFRSHSIAQVLQLSVHDAIALFSDDKPIARMLDVLVRTGMGYLTLGQPTTTLSGGEAQRIKLAKEIGRKAGNQQTLFVLDEPTTGLSLFDTAKLMDLLHEVQGLGSTIIVIEHDPAVLSQCDWLLELGPGGGNNGGQLVAQGSVEDLKVNPASVIGPFLQPPENA